MMKHLLVGNLVKSDDPEQRCTGHCCRAFSIGGHAGLTARYEKALAVPEGERSQWDKECIDLFRILVPLPAKTIEYGSNPYEPAVGWSHGHRAEDGRMHTCKNLLENGDCGDYENRPSMCRSYPDGRPCLFIHCTSVHAIRFKRGDGVLPSELLAPEMLLRAMIPLALREAIGSAQAEIAGTPEDREVDVLNEGPYEGQRVAAEAMLVVVGG
jgi:Fe-S-cluster containining protein